MHEGHEEHLSPEHDLCHAWVQPVLDEDGALLAVEFGWQVAADVDAVEDLPDWTRLSLTWHSDNAQDCHGFSAEVRTPVDTDEGYGQAVLTMNCPHDNEFPATVIHGDRRNRTQSWDLDDPALRVRDGAVVLRVGLAQLDETFSPHLAPGVVLQNPEARTTRYMLQWDMTYAGRDITLR